jgi:hypothetical protein
MMSVVSRLSIKTIVISFVILSCAAIGFSQPRPAKSSDFNVEILNLDRPSFILSLPEPPHRTSYFAHVKLKRIPEWQRSAEVPAEASALRVQFWLEAGKPNVEITAFLGKLPPNSRPSEWEQIPKALVAARALLPDELVTIAEAEKFGIEPFQVRAFKAHPWSVGPPEIINQTQAITVLDVSESRPHYILRIRNVSHKGIDAIRWSGNDNRGALGQRGGSAISGAPVIAPGCTFELRQRFGFNEEKQRTESGESETERSIEISAIVFDDGSFEGSADDAAEMAANLAGERQQLKRIKSVLPTPTSALREPDILKKFRSNIAALSEEADPELVNELTIRFATATEDMRNRRIKEEVIKGLRSTKNHFLREIEKLEFRRENSTEADFDRWLKDLLDMFQGTRTN